MSADRAIMKKQVCCFCYFLTLFVAFIFSPALIQAQTPDPNLYCHVTGTLEKKLGGATAAKVQIKILSVTKSGVAIASGTESFLTGTNGEVDFYVRRGSTACFYGDVATLNTNSAKGTCLAIPDASTANFGALIPAQSVPVSIAFPSQIGQSGKYLRTVNNVLQWATVAGGGGGGSGTVESVSAGNLSPVFTASVANSTTTPAITFTLSSQAANRIFAGPSTGAAAAPTFRALVEADIPTLAQSKITSLTTDLAGKQAALVSGTTIKTINGTSLLGSGDITISGGGGSPSWGSITGTLSSQTDLQSALNAKESSITAGTTAQYWRGDKSWQTLNKAAVGLGNVDNTSDASKPISTATQTALDLKANTASLATVAISGSYSDLSGRPTLGTASALNVAASGNAASGEVVKGDDTRLTDSRTPTVHNQSWSTITSTPTTRSGYGITDAAANGAVTSSGLTMATARLLGRSTASTGAIEEITVGSGLTLSGGTLSASGGGGGSGTVNSGTTGKVPYYASTGTALSASTGLEWDNSIGALTLRDQASHASGSIGRLYFSNNGNRIEGGWSQPLSLTSAGASFFSVPFNTTLGLGENFLSTYTLLVSTNNAGPSVQITSRDTGVTGLVVNNRPSTTAPIAKFQINGTDTVTITKDGEIKLRSVTFSALPTVTSGALIYCSDCTVASPCASGGSGAFAKGINSAWVCN